MKILGLDPDSHAIGYALVRDDYHLLEAGRIGSDIKKARAAERIESMVDELSRLLVELEPEIIAIEWTAGKTAGRLQNKKTSGLAVYGIAVGAAWRECKNYKFIEKSRQGREVEVLEIDENEWTKETPKGERLKIIEALYPEYDMEKDPGGHMGDAIGIARYWAEKMRWARILQIN